MRLGVRALPIKSDLPAGSTFRGYPVSQPTGAAATRAVAPTADEIAYEIYPLARYFRLYVDQDPSKSMDPTLRAFLLRVLSPQAQSVMTNAGYLALNVQSNAEMKTLILGR
jgi:ABC-type phosphate transport system substrate-binding protein